jgi:uncharacterized membrane protein
MDDVENAVNKLKEGEVATEQVSVVSKSLESGEETHGYITSGAEVGAWTGGLFGLLAGSAFLWLPGVGFTVIIGTLASTLLAGVEGAVAGALGGGLIGSLLGEKISKEHIGKYEEMLKGGNHLVIVQGSSDEAKRAYDILKDTNEVALDLHMEKSM